MPFIPLNPEQCTRCETISEYYVQAETEARKAILCSDCCLQLISFLGSTGQLKKDVFIDFAENTKI